MEKNNSNSSRKTSVYSPVILNQKTKDVVFSLFDRLREHGKLAGLKITNLGIEIEMTEKGELSYQVYFDYGGLAYGLLNSENIADFDMEFIKFLFTIK